MQRLASSTALSGGVIHRHTVMEAYPGDMLGGVSAVHLYGARVLASTRPGDIVMVHPDVGTLGTEWICAHYHRVGLDVASNFVFSEDYMVTTEYPDHPMSVFLFDRHAHAARPNEDFSRVAEAMNNKNEFIRFCHAQGAPTPRTTMFASSTEARAYTPDTFPIYLKGACSASGQHVFCCDNPGEYQAKLQKIEGACQVQEALPPEAVFCNIQYGTTYRKGVRQMEHGPLTRQRLDGNAHDGNIFPSGVDPDLIQPITDKLSRVLFERGLEGEWAFDVAVHGFQVWLIECNPRWNGATYFAKPAGRLRARTWEGLNVKVRFNSFTFMTRTFDDLEYDPVKGAGIVIINWATIVGQKLGILVIGDEETRQRLITEFRRRYCG